MISLRFGLFVNELNSLSLLYDLVNIFSNLNIHDILVLAKYEGRIINNRMILMKMYNVLICIKF